MDTNSSLCSLMEQEYYVMKVLEALVPDGLHECRRVCHNWKAACDKLPQRISASAPDQIPFAVEQFPHATHLNFAFNPKQGNDPDEMDVCLSADFFRLLPRLKSLEKFTCWMKGSWCFPDALEMNFKAMTRLKRFEIVLHEMADGLSLLYNALRYLTGLTILNLYTPNDGVPCIEPFTELHNIKELGICLHLFANQNGALLFPPSQTLTRLMFNIEPQFQQHEDKILKVRSPPIKLSPMCDQVASPYAKHLKSLEFWWLAKYYDISFANMTLLPCFDKLETLALPRMKRAPTNLFTVLKQMGRLTDLDIRDVHDDSPVVVQSIAALTRLRSLLLFRKFTVGGVFVSASEISQLTQLTHLTIGGYDVGASLTCLINLVDLSFYAPLSEATVDASWNFQGLSKLKFLAFHCQLSPLFTSSVLPQLKNLRHLEMDAFIVTGNEDIFWTLSGLTELRLLRISQDGEESAQLPLSEVTRLTSLYNLELDCLPPCHPYDYVKEGTLPRLRYITVMHPELDDEMRAELRRRLPCLRKVLRRCVTGELE